MVAGEEAPHHQDAHAPYQDRLTFVIGTVVETSEAEARYPPPCRTIIDEGLLTDVNNAFRFDSPTAQRASNTEGLLR